MAETHPQGDGTSPDVETPAGPGDWRLFALLAGVLFAGLWFIGEIGLPVALVAWATVFGVARTVLRPRPGPARPPVRGRRALVWPDSGMRAVAEGLSDPAILTDANGIVRYANAEAAERFGLVRPGDPLNFRLRNTALLDALDRVVALDEAESVAWQEKIPTERWFEAHLAPIHHPPDPQAVTRRPDFVLIVVEDQTDQFRAERMRADFVANASHELRTPLSALTGFVETLQGPARNDPQARERFLGIMAEQAARMRRLIDDLLSLSRIEMKAHLRPDTIVNLDEILASVPDLLASLARAAGMTLRLEIAQRPMPTRGDRDELIQVFTNLVENAIKYGEKGEVEIAARGEDGPGEGKVWAVSVTDHGPGIAAVHLPRLTERFYRASIVSSREKQGTGLGLAIVKHILARHQGRLSIESEVGKGSTFTVRLPAARAET
jgi:two-component system phosphate regulon sensor histidine kinase PhoR